MTDIPRGTTDAEEAALILRGHEERITRLEEDRDNTRLVQTYRTYTDEFGLDDALALTLGGDVEFADAFGLDDALTISTKSTGGFEWRAADEPWRFSTWGQVDYATDLFGEAGFGEDGFGE